MLHVSVVVASDELCIVMFLFLVDVLVDVLVVDLVVV
jgi:hypothetical protein